MNNAVRILSVCDDDGLRLSREMLLRNSGYEVESVSSYDFLGVSYVRTFEIALVCTSIHGSRVGPLTEKLARYNPEIQILDMDDLRIKAELWYDANSPVPIGPTLLLDALGDLCEQAGKKIAQPIRLPVKKLPRSSRRSLSVSVILPKTM